MQTWDSVFLGLPEAPDPPGTVVPPPQSAAAKAEPKAEPRPVMRTPMSMVAEGLKTLAETAVQVQKPVYVNLPCFTC